MLKHTITVNSNADRIRDRKIEHSSKLFFKKLKSEEFFFYETHCMMVTYIFIVIIKKNISIKLEFLSIKKLVTSLSFQNLINQIL